jgi:hypothetical protein
MQTGRWQLEEEDKMDCLVVAPQPNKRDVAIGGARDSTAVQYVTATLLSFCNEQQKKHKVLYAYSRFLSLEVVAQSPAIFLPLIGCVSLFCV